MDLKNSIYVEFIKANKELLNSNLNPVEKVDAIRKQTFVLEELTKSSTEASRISLFRHHFGKFSLNDDSYLTHIKSRIKGVDKLVSDLPPCKGRPEIFSELCAEKFLKANNINLEQSCSGIYESCCRNEITASDLEPFQKICGKVTSVLEIKTPPRKMIKSDTSLVNNPGISSCSTGRSFTSHPVTIIQEIKTPPRKMIKSDTSLVNKPGISSCSTGRSFTSNPVSSVNTESTALKTPGFRTAREEFIIQTMKKKGDSNGSSSNNLFNYGASKKSLGARRNVRCGFVPPIRPEDNGSSRNTPPDASDVALASSEPVDERLRNIDPKMIELISNEIMHKYKPIDWNDIAGLDYAKSTIKEAIVWPLLRPDIFTGLRRPPRGILLFGPPGTGKTLIGKCIASQSRSTFFSISASSLTSKWIGDGEKMVRALFAVAAVNQPAVVFIDEIDSLLSQRSESEHESSRRLKTEFLVQLDGASTSDDERILIVGATNRPQELDEAARRRLVRRLYIPLPESTARVQILSNLLKTVRNSMTETEIIEVGNLTSGYSGADMETLCREASMEPIRSIPPDEIPFFSEENVRPVQLNDFRLALQRVRASVSEKDLQQYVDWNRTYGAGQ